jgi:cyanate permease
MNATTTNRARLAGVAPATSPEAATDYLRRAQNAFLTELPGLAFGIVTLAYIASALLRLA